MRSWVRIGIAGSGACRGCAAALLSALSPGRPDPHPGWRRVLRRHRRASLALLPALPLAFPPQLAAHPADFIARMPLKFGLRHLRDRRRAVARAELSGRKQAKTTSEQI